MKNLISILFAVVGIAFLTSCDKEISSLENTQWKQVPNELYEVSMYELDFTSTQATITKTYGDGFKEIATGTYTYDPPSVEIAVSESRFGEVVIQHPSPQRQIGTVKRKIMTLAIFEGDIRYSGVEFKMQ